MNDAILKFSSATTELTKEIQQFLSESQKDWDSIVLDIQSLKETYNNDYLKVKERLSSKIENMNKYVLELNE
ncbi:hypothetical protein O9G_004296 [Rozella allomycis CSF55]|uniref:Uncharacterized protein n=1 Tax=Rozella allomycis (strain CSF55) TaxID=988480 RepID=A0A075ARI2_ROZAC|nr:hypothetical protein O9G_004296 [Rozella allomycis CSF55]|eukprot:EPZ32853.1 hypothetical protein O9G_004296 [Rozella allomycis CSF55]